MFLSKRQVMNNHRIFFLPLVMILLMTSGCAWWKSADEDETVNWSASRFYNEAKQELNDGNYDTAIDYYERLQARYPFGRFAQQAQLEIIYAHYKAGEPDLAIAAADRFIQTHPRHPYVDYAHYLKGLTNFDRGVGLIEKLLPSDPSQTDSSNATQAFNDFAELVQKFPDSQYADDARQRMLFLRNNLASYEIHVADFYMRRNAYVAAANRAKYVVENYPSTPAVADALAVMSKAYIKLELMELANDSYRVLQLNYPDSPQAVEVSALLDGREPPGKGFSLFGLEF
jgi:outer membrane protein assembly factor BamD